jgi:hypothetical protein
MENSPVKQYGVRLELPNTHTIVDITGDDLAGVKENVQSILKGGCRFEPFGSTNTLLIYHPTHDGGKTPMSGWVSVWDVPENMSNRTLIGRRGLQAA